MLSRSRYVYVKEVLAKEFRIMLSKLRLFALFLWKSVPFFISVIFEYMSIQLVFE